MLSDRDALLAAIRANPEEDTPRLMFADWLDEQGNEASATRAEFIRLQCELARLTDDASDSQPVYEFLRDHDWVTRPSADWTQIDDGIHRRIALSMRVEDLIKQHGEEWLPKLPKKYKVQWSGFHRGFPHRVTLGSAAKLKEAAPRLRGSAPAVTLISHSFTREFVEELGDAGLLGWISGLDLAGECGEGLREFGRRREAAGVRAIRVNHRYNDEHVWAITEARHWTGLRTLDLSETLTSPGTAESIFQAKNLRTLKQLDISGHLWPNSTVSILAQSVLSELTSLRISGCFLEANAAELLARCGQFAKLRKLELPFNNITGRGITALLTSPHLANVAFLGVDHNPAFSVNAKKLAKAKPGALRMLHAHGCRFRTTDVRALSRCPRLRTLWYLDLDDNYIGTPAVRELVRGFKNFCPPIIWLTHNRIDDRGAELLAKWKAATALRILHLKYTGITDAGVRAMLDSSNLANLDGLGVPNPPAISEETEAQLKARFKFHGIHYA